jgi:predicted nucleic acid-binding protein
MRAVIDTNVFVSSFFDGNPRKVIGLWRDGKISLCLSKGVVDEYIEVLQRLGTNEEELSGLLALFAAGTQLYIYCQYPRLENCGERSR